ncbi:MAG: RluA family pseudouridine synthase [Bacilli bacterium]|nr:RluA family pseudouridine synthase [Bacilli bacterium]
MIKILYEDNHILVVEKPINMPTQEDDSKDPDLLTELKKYIKVKYNKPGNVYLGLVHRLDRPVGGVMVFAKTSKAASRLSEQVRNHTLDKSYYAIVMGKVDGGILNDKLLKNPKTNMTVVSEKGKEAVLTYKLVDYKDGMSLVDINLETGRSHQIRVQFSSRNYPLYGDQKYNKDAKVGEQIALFSYKLSLIHPVTKEKMEFSLDMPNTYPWNLFK